MHELPDGSVQMYLRDPADNLVEIDWPDARALDPRIREELISLSSVVPQTGGALSATLYLDRRDGGVDQVRGA
jgi:lactoylglutathione lyase